MSGNSELINSFMQAWNKRDVNAVMDHFTEDAAYANIPMGPPHIGKKAIQEFIEGFIGSATSIEFTVHNQVEGDSGIVMNERTDVLVMGDNKIELPVMGVFEFQNGKISAWRDYFDMAVFSAMAG